MFKRKLRSIKYLRGIKKIRKIKKIYVVSILCSVLIFCGLFFGNNKLARFFWNNFRDDRVAKLISDDSDLLFEIGNYYFNGGEYNLGKAKAAYDEIKKINNDYPGVNYQLARVYFIKGDLKTAHDLIDKELLTHSDFKRSHYARGLINAYAGNLLDAEQDFREFLKFDSRSWAAYNDLAFVYWKMENYEMMKETTEKGLSFNSGNTWLLITLSNAFLNLGEYQKSLDTLSEAEKNIASVTEEMWKKAYPGNSPDGARDGIVQMNGTIIFNKGLAFERKGDLQNALDTFKKLKELNVDGLLVDEKSLEDKIVELEVGLKR